MNVFPDTDVFVISYVPGCCGSFISLLISEFLGIKADVEFSDHGNAHDAQPLFNQAIKKNTFSEYNFMDVEPIDKSKPLIIHEHTGIDYELLFTKYPKAKNLVVHVKTEDMLMMGANFYFKCKVDSFDSQTHLHSVWKEESEKFFGGAESPFDPSVTDDMILDYLKSYRGRKVWHPFRDNSHLPDNENIYRIGFSDVFKNRPALLHVISKMTGMPIPISVYHTYDKYIQAQRPIWDFIGWKQEW